MLDGQLPCPWKPQFLSCECGCTAVIDGRMTWVQAAVAVLALAAGIAALVVRKVRLRAPSQCMLYAGYCKGQGLALRVLCACGPLQTQ